LTCSTSASGVASTAAHSSATGFAPPAPPHRLHGADGAAVTRAIDRDRDDCGTIHDCHCSSTSNLLADLQKVALSGHSGEYYDPHRFDESG